MKTLETNRQVALDTIQAIAAGDRDRMEELMHPALTWWVIGFGDFDRATLIDQIIGTFATATVRRIDVIGTTAEDDRIAVRAESHFEFADGRTFAGKYLFLLVVREGQVIDGCEYIDTAYVMSFMNGKSAAS